MPATARLRVSGAITSLLGSVIGPSLKASKSLVGVLIFLIPGNCRSTGGGYFRWPRQEAVGHWNPAQNSAFFRHCEQSEAIHTSAQRKNGLLRRYAPRNDG